MSRKWVHLLFFILAFIWVNPEFRLPTRIVQVYSSFFQNCIQKTVSGDLDFVPPENYLEGLLFEVRNSPNEKYYIPLYDHIWEQYIYERSIPKLLVAPQNLQNENDSISKYYGYGPQKPAPLLELKNSYLNRWTSMLLVLICLIGSSFFIKNISISLRILSGFLITGWGILLISLITKLNYQDIYKIWIPASVILFIILLIRNFQFSKFKEILIKNKNIWFLILLFSMIVSPFLFDPLQGADARTMWFYRYKFAYFYGFQPDLIAKYMFAGAQRDYSWVFAGPLGIASMFPNSSYAGWNENAVYGALLWLHLAVLFLAFNSFKNVQFMIKAFLLLFTFYTFKQYATNGYFDFFWMFLIALIFLKNDLSKKEKIIITMLAASIKYEAIAVLIMYLLFQFIHSIKMKNNIKDFIKTNQFIFVSMIPLLLQKQILKAFGIMDQYNVGSLFFKLTIYEAIKRFESANRFIIKRVFIERPQYLVIAILFLFIYRNGKEMLRSLGFIYYLMLPAILIYTFTPYDQDWQLETSAFRVFMFFPIYLALYFLKKSEKTF